MACSDDFPGQHPGDEEARDDEEDVDADKPATDSWDAGVEQDDGQHRDGPQAIDVGPETGLCLFFAADGAPVSPVAGPAASLNQVRRGHGPPSTDPLTGKP